MITIHKYEIESYHPETLMPKDAEILTVAIQGNKFLIWARVDTENPLEERKFHAFSTNSDIEVEIPPNFKYIGTGFTIDGLVSHAFEELPIHSQKYMGFYSL